MITSIKVYGYRKRGIWIQDYRHTDPGRKVDGYGRKFGKVDGYGIIEK
jgi:hypothetical protein